MKLFTYYFFARYDGHNSDAVNKKRRWWHRLYNWAIWLHLRQGYSYLVGLILVAFYPIDFLTFLCYNHKVIHIEGVRKCIRQTESDSKSCSKVVLLRLIALRT